MRHQACAFRTLSLLFILTCASFAQAQYFDEGRLSFFAAPKRLPAREPQLDLFSNERGTVVVGIAVDRNGKIASAKVAKTGTTCRDSVVFEQAVAIARKYEFNAEPNAPNVQRGKIVWEFDERGVVAGISMEEHMDAVDMPIEPPVEDPIYDIAAVQEQPLFPGGEQAMHNYLITQLKYPEDAREMNVQGKVYVQFTVDTNGNHTDVELKRGVYASLDREAMRVIMAMPKWTPGKLGGRAVAVRMIVPITFNLR